MADNAHPSTDVKIAKRDITVSWYSPSIGSQLTPQARRLLEEYSHVPSADVENHVLSIRSRAWKIHPYPCIGQFRFLDLSISLLPSYATILSRLAPKQQSTSEPQILLDLGCCFGQDIRKLVADGVPAEQLYGCDLRKEFFELGYELFLDQDTLKSQFLAGDVFAERTAPAGKELAKLDGKPDIVHIASFLHLFDLAGQTAACERIVKLLKPKEGSLVVGRQVGSAVAGEKLHRTNKGGSIYRHDENSFKEMWKEVGKRTGTNWRVEVQGKAVPVGMGDFNSPLHDEFTRRLTFSVWRE